MSLNTTIISQYRDYTDSYAIKYNDAQPVNLLADKEVDLHNWFVYKMALCCMVTMIR